MATKYQVFVSSTYEDLKEERQAIIRAILEMGHIPVGMEMFSAADEEQWKIIARNIEESDYYVVILAHRYGSTIGNVSYTQKEYEHATSHGVPTIGFIIDPSASWPGDRIETSDRKKASLTQFKQLVQTKPVGYWSSADDLYGKCSIALMKAMTANPRVGWVRASAATGPEVTAEISRLSSENAALRSRLAEAEDESGREQALAFQRDHETLKGIKRRLSVRVHPGEDWVDGEEVSLDKVFQLLATIIFVEDTLESAASFIALHVTPDPKGESDIIPLNLMTSLLMDLVTFDLVEPSKRKHSVQDKGEYWSLSERGIEFAKWLRRRRLEAAAQAAENLGLAETGLAAAPDS